MTFKYEPTHSKDATGHPFFRRKIHNRLLYSQMHVL